MALMGHGKRHIYPLLPCIRGLPFGASQDYHHENSGTSTVFKGKMPPEMRKLYNGVVNDARGAKFTRSARAAAVRRTSATKSDCVDDAHAR